MQPNDLKQFSGHLPYASELLSQRYRRRPAERAAVWSVRVLVGSIAAITGACSAGSPSADRATTTTDRTAVVPSTTLPPAADQKTAEALAAALSSEWDGVVPDADLACLGDAIRALKPGDQGTVAALVEAPPAYSLVGDSVRYTIAATYYGCVEDDEVVLTVVLGSLGVEDVTCVTEAWKGKLTGGIVAASIAYGSGLDDLPPDLVDDLAVSVTGCEDDIGWWTDEVALEVADTTDLPDAVVGCVATAYIDTFGVERVAARQILTLGLLATVSADDMQRLDLPGRCSVELTPISGRLGANVGACLTGFDSREATPEIVDCGVSHDAEVIGVHDLSAMYAAWPGARTMNDDADSTCRADFSHLPDDKSLYAYVGHFVTREGWERGERELSCLIVRDGGAQWVGPSGLAS